MFVIRPQGWAALLVLAFAPPGWGHESPKQSRPAKPCVDLYGDPLPQGAIARLGTVRFRHLGAVYEVAFSPDGKLIAASSDGLNMVILWDRTTGRKIREITLGTRPSYQPTRLCFSADGKRLYACSWYGRNMSLYAWDVESGRNAKDVPPLPAGM